MTCIVGIVAKDGVWIGGDAAGARSTSDWVPTDISSMTRPKVFRNGRMLFGYTTSFRMGQILEHVFVPPYEEGGTVDKFLCGTFIKALRECFTANGFGALKDMRKEEAGAFLLGYAGRLFEVQEDYSVLETDRDFAAVGCGANHAKGSLHTTGALGTHAPDVRLLLALEAAANLNAGVRRPFTIKHLDVSEGRA